MQEEYKSAFEGVEDLNTRMVKLGELNELTYEDLIFSINTSSSVDKHVFGLVKNAKSEEFRRETAKWHGTGQ